VEKEEARTSSMGEGDLSQILENGFHIDI